MSVTVTNENGRYLIRAYWTQVLPNGKRRHCETKRRLPEGTTLAQAERMRRIAEGRLAEGVEPFGSKKTPIPKGIDANLFTLGQWYEARFLPEKRVSVKPRTIEIYEASWQRIEPVLGNLIMGSITREDVRQFFVRVQEGADLARNTIDQIYRNLSAIFNHAIDLEKLDRNPCRGARKVFAQARPQVEENPLTPHEYLEFMQAVRARFPDYYSMFLCLFHTAMRPMEAAGLQWGDVDFNARRISIRRQVRRDGSVQTIKTNRVDTVPLSDELAQEFVRWQKEAKASWFKKGMPCPVWLFPNRAGNPRDMCNLRERQWKACLKQIGATPRALYCTRHTTPTLLIQVLDVNIKVVQKIMRHKKISTTLDRYGHLYSGDAHRAINRLSELGKILGGIGRNSAENAPFGGGNP